MHRAKLPPGMELENLREFAKRHTVPVNPDQERVGGHGSGMAQTFSAQVPYSAPTAVALSVACFVKHHVLKKTPHTLLSKRNVDVRPRPCVKGKSTQGSSCGRQAKV